MLSTPASLQQAQQEIDAHQEADTTIRLDPFELDWTGWRDLALDPVGFPAIQSDVYDIDFNPGPFYLEGSGFQHNIEDDCTLDAI